MNRARNSALYFDTLVHFWKQIRFVHPMQELYDLVVQNGIRARINDQTTEIERLRKCNEELVRKIDHGAKGQKACRNEIARLNTIITDLCEDDYP